MILEQVRNCPSSYNHQLGHQTSWVRSRRSQRQLLRHLDLQPARSPPEGRSLAYADGGRGDA